jgi:hypothetical protein
MDSCTCDTKDRGPYDHDENCPRHVIAKAIRDHAKTLPPNVIVMNGFAKRRLFSELRKHLGN